MSTDQLRKDSGGAARLAADVSGEIVDIGVLAGSKSRQARDRRIRFVLMCAASFSVLIGLGIVVSLLGETIKFFAGVDPGSLLESGWFPRRGKFDFRTIIVGSVIVTGVAMAVAVPLGLGAAVYLSEYANRRVRVILKPVVEILAGVPSVVLGYFALLVISPSMVQRVWTDANIFSMMAAGIGVGILVIPIIASIAEDALRSVPDTLRYASVGVGARRLTTTMRVVVPAAVSGIVASVIVGVSRAIGETMVVYIAAGAVGGSEFTLNPLSEGQTMTAAMMSLAAGSDQVKGGSGAYASLFAIGTILFLITLALNSLGERLVRRVRHRY